MECAARMLCSLPLDPCTDEVFHFFQDDDDDEDDDDVLVLVPAKPHTAKAAYTRQDLRVRCVYRGVTLVFGKALDCLQCRERGTSLVREALQDPKGPGPVAAVARVAIDAISKDHRVKRIRLDNTLPEVINFHTYVSGCCA